MAGYKNASTLRDRLMSYIPADCPNLGFDRDLGVAGRVMVRSKDGLIGQKLVHIDRPSES
jgi:aminopeptidase I zinc metalloprotease (M18)